MGRRSRVVSVATRAGKTPGAFGDFEEDEPVYPEVLGDDDAPTASGEFASKLSLELRARGMDANGDGAAEPTVSDDAPALDAPGLIARMRANRPGATPLSRLGAGGQAAFALAVSAILWCLPGACASCWSAVAPAVPALAPVVDAFARLRALGVGFNPGVAAACTTATFKVILLCVVVGRLMRGGALPRETPVVLSKLAFNVLLPTYMCTRVAQTLDATPLTLGLATLPLSAVAQVVVGGTVGAALTAATSSIPGWIARAWHPVAAPSEGAGDIAANVAAAAGVPAETLNVANTRGGREVERRRDREASRADPMAKVGIACCAFGNTFTLPLVFLAEVLGASYADKVAGFIALYLIGWSPALWTVGYQLLAGGDGDGSAAGADAGEEDASKSPPASLWATTKYLVKETVNPPLIGIFLGVLIGVSPARFYLLGGASAAAAAASLPPDLGVVANAARAAFELAVLLGGATLPVQTLVLASSFVKIPTAEETEAVEAATLAKAAAAAVEVSRGATATAGGGAAWFSTRRAALVAEGAARSVRGVVVAAAKLFAMDESDVRALFVASALRFVVLPLGGVLCALALRAANSPWYPNDPVVAVVVMTMAAMPPAQNLVLLTNLREETRPLAPRLAGLLLRMYVLAIVPTTVWLTVFTAAVA